MKRSQPLFALSLGLTLLGRVGIGRARLRFPVAAIALLALAFLSASPAAFAQDLRPPASVPGAGAAQPFNLFGGWFAPPRQTVPVQPPAPKRVAPPPEPEGVVHGSLADAVEGKKQPPTKFVLVIGDRLAAQLAQGLADAYVTDRSSPAVIGVTDDESGFLAPTPPGGTDWLTKGPEAIAAARPNGVVVALGSNDLQPIADGDTKVEPLTDRWQELYAKRVADVLGALRARTGNIILVGLAPVQNASLFADYEKLNDVLRAQAVRANVVFAPVWDGFVDEEGKYAASGAAVDGQRRRLRFNDGVRFTRAGARKLAFFTQKDLTRFLTETPRIEESPEAGKDGSRGPLSLSDIARGASTLAGGPNAGNANAIPVKLQPNDAARALLEGTPMPTVRGRADDYSWPPGAAATPAPVAAPSADEANPVQAPPQ
ncbi:SGNH/GDSL hydrolase family protein [Roseixanthobacter pseudopolyaromaticivorans]|uniref:SGNH/GDSL hydrolase family protein n=1 Tax=Xanthobacteraceae TaxID=335928 RepID=UPI00372A30E5